MQHQFRFYMPEVIVLWYFLSAPERTKEPTDFHLENWRNLEELHNLNKNPQIHKWWLRWKTIKSNIPHKHVCRWEITYWILMENYSTSVANTIYSQCFVVLLAWFLFFHFLDTFRNKKYIVCSFVVKFSRTDVDKFTFNFIQNYSTFWVACTIYHRIFDMGIWKMYGNEA